MHRAWKSRWTFEIGMFLRGCESRAGCVVFIHFNLCTNLFVVVVVLLKNTPTASCARMWKRIWKGNVPWVMWEQGWMQARGFEMDWRLELLGWTLYKAYVGVIGWLKTTTGSTRVWRSRQKAHYWKRMLAKCSLFRFMHFSVYVSGFGDQKSMPCCSIY